MKDILLDIPPEGHLASVNGMEMYYEMHGEGSPLLLLHGFTGCIDWWGSCMGEFAKHFRTIAIDLRGHGWSTNPSNEFTHRQCALDVFALMDKLGIGRFKAIGHSSGGNTLVHMATQQPERIDAMILMDSAIYLPEETRVIFRHIAARYLSTGAWEPLRQYHKHGDDQIRAMMTQLNDLADSYDDMNFTPPYLSTIRARTLIVHGDRDEVYPMPMPVEMYRAIPHSYLWIVPNGGHAPHEGKHEALFIDTALEFLSGAWDE
jgi:pimeloyl-ACP methyl ester carboxylesterase